MKATWPCAVFAAATLAAAPARAEEFREPIALAPLKWVAEPSRADRESAFPKGGDKTALRVFWCRLDAAGGLERCALAFSGPYVEDEYTDAARRLLPRYRAALGSAGGLVKSGVDVEVAITLTPRDAPTTITPRPSVVFRDLSWAAAPDTERVLATMPPSGRAEDYGFNYACVIGAAGELANCQTETLGNPPADLLPWAAGVVSELRVQTVVDGIDVVGLGANFSFSTGTSEPGLID